MKIIEPSFEILTPFGKLDESIGRKMLQFIERMGRISHKSEIRQTEDSWEKFITSVVLQHGDWSITEHQSVTVIFEVNRGITHEAVRHRLFGFTQESTRFVNYSKNATNARYIPSIEVTPADLDEWIQDLAIADATYLKWLKRGYAPQVARDHLPNALAASISVTGNLRNWRHFFLMRTSKETHPDFRRVTYPLLDVFKVNVPLLFEDIEVGQRQIENLRKPR